MTLLAVPKTIAAGSLKLAQVPVEAALGVLERLTRSESDPRFDEIAEQAAQRRAASQRAAEDERRRARQRRQAREAAAKKTAGSRKRATQKSAQKAKRDKARKARTGDAD